MAIALDQVIPWGRSLAEYQRMFALEPKDLSAGVLDCGGGPASFTAESSANGARVVSVDPLYGYSGPDIRARFEAVEPNLMAQVEAAPQHWVWSYHRNPGELRENRRRAVARFLADYEAGRRAHRYIIGELPRLPFKSHSFGLSLCSHLLFLYSDLLTPEFHVQSLLEMCRVAREARVFPLLNLNQKPSPHLTGVRVGLKREGLLSQVVRVDYELQRGGNEMLRVFGK